MNLISGTAAVFARDDIDTDLIIPACYLTTSDPAVLAEHVLEAIDGEKLAATANPIVVAGANFGCGSSREHAVWALEGAGVKAVIADSFARIFFRNAVNFGLPMVVIEKAATKFDAADELEIDFENSVVRNLTRDESHEFQPLPRFLQEIVDAGGLLNQIQN